MQTASADEGKSLQKQASGWVNSQVLACMEDYLAEVEDLVGKDVVRFDRLNIQLQLKDGKLDDSDIDRQIREQLDARIRNFLRNRKSNNPVSLPAVETPPETKAYIVDPAERDQQAILHFLQTGRNPWWMSAQTLTELLSEASVEKLFAEAGQPFHDEFVSMIEAPAAASRLVRQFTDKLLHRLLTNAFYRVKGRSVPNKNTRHKEDLPAFTKRLAFTGRESFWLAAINLLHASRVGKEIPKRFWADLIRPMLKPASPAAETRIQESLRHFPSWLEALTQLSIPVQVKEEWLHVPQQDELQDRSGPGSRQASDELRAGLKGNDLLTDKDENEKKKKEKDQASKDQAASGSGEAAGSGAKQKGATIEEAGAAEKDGNDPQRTISQAKSAAAQATPDPSVASTGESAVEKNRERIPGSETTHGIARDFKPVSPSSKPIPEKGIIAENAGLILLHPFLKSFLVKLDLMDENMEFPDPELAVHVLHYIATGVENDWEHNLTFEKFLCNIPLEESIDRSREIPEEAKEETDRLLEAIRQNWKAIGRSSVDLLRKEFLQRPGKLFMDEISVRLNVERKTHDILLDRIPWNVSMAKLPWQKQLIYTTW